jgi:hypothetical protein
MTTKSRTLAITLTGLVATASGASALGAQADDGGATAASHRIRPAHRLHDLATRLGVEPARLREAQHALRPERRDFREGRAAELASALGLTTAQVSAALERIRADRPARGERGAALAEALGVTRAQLHAARRTLRPAARDAYAAALAAKLGLSTAQVREALAAGPHHGGPWHP